VTTLYTGPVTLTFRQPDSGPVGWRPIVDLTILRADSGRPVQVPAVFDTGAEHSFFPASFADRLGVHVEWDCDPEGARMMWDGLYPGRRYRGELQAQLSAYSFPWRGDFLETEFPHGALGGDFLEEFDLCWQRRQDRIAVTLDPIAHPERDGPVAA
jgi:hypothetical protein